MRPSDLATRPVAELSPYAANSRTHSDAQVAQIAASITEFGFTNPVLIDGEGGIIAGHGRVLAAKSLGLASVPVLVLDHLTAAQRRAYVIADNRIALSGGWDEDILRAEIEALGAEDIDLDLLGFDDDELDALLNPHDAEAEPGDTPTGAGSLAERFGIPPFSVLNAREGWWQDRKRAWLSLGIASELGRGDDGTGREATLGTIPSNQGDLLPKGVKKADARAFAVDLMRGERDLGAKGNNADAPPSAGISIFDPVLTELAYRWFCPPGGAILDPFAGGSVRGIVASKLGRLYTGVDLSGAQVAANQAQWPDIRDKTVVTDAGWVVADDAMPDTTPIERRGGIWIKRDDAFSIGGGKGGKVRTCWGLAQGATGLVTAGSRSSPQVNIVAQIARKLGLPCRVHTPEGELSPEVLMAQQAGAEVVQHKAGYNNVIIARAREDAQARGWREIPFGMECPEAVARTAAEVRDIPEGVQRVVVPVGSGMSLAGILHGLDAAGLGEMPVLGVQVGADPCKRLDAYAPANWRERCTLVHSGLDYATAAPLDEWEGVRLDPIYEAKCLPHLQPGDLLWVVGLRATAALTPAPRREAPAPRWINGNSADLATLTGGAPADFVFSCPPYADLERYSDDPADLSTMDYAEFVAAYRDIIAAACAQLKPDRFACFVVGDVRDKKGNYRNFVGDTVEAFRAAGLSFYNEAILVTAVGSLPQRAGRQFAAGRKLGKTHQNVLVFLKGDAKKAVAALGDVEFGDLVEAELGGEGI